MQGVTLLGVPALMSAAECTHKPPTCTAHMMTHNHALPARDLLMSFQHKDSVAQALSPPLVTGAAPAARRAITVSVTSHRD